MALNRSVDLSEGSKASVSTFHAPSATEKDITVYGTSSTAKVSVL